jgi:hypothetical protein
MRRAGRRSARASPVAATPQDQAAPEAPLCLGPRTLSVLRYIVFRIADVVHQCCEGDDDGIVVNRSICCGFDLQDVGCEVEHLFNVGVVMGDII